ncbi:YtcA family lipoprotein [Xanthobacter sediminis]
MSPSLPLFGAYFPSWLICAAAGVIGAVVMRGVFIRLGIDEVLPWRLLVYACLAALIGFVVALTVYGR